ncbi:MAG: class I SAM-dependent methyltransferase [Bacteroidota bacterium]
MNETHIHNRPIAYDSILRKSREMGFSMISDLYMGSLLKTLVSSKPKGHFLELGTGSGLGTSWILDGMDRASKLITVDNDPEIIAIAKQYFGKDNRANLVCMDGGEWIKTYNGEPFDLIFADAWPGKFYEVPETLALVRPGGFYLIDDLLPGSDWPEGHQEKVDDLISYLDQRTDFELTKMQWSTGLIIATRKIE